MYSILRIQAKPRVVNNERVGFIGTRSSATQCNFFLETSELKHVQSAKSLPSTKHKSIQCEILEDLSFVTENSKSAKVRMVQCQTSCEKRSSTASQVPDLTNPQSPVIKEALYLLRSLQEFDDFGYYVLEDLLYIYLLKFETKSSGSPIASLVISGNGVCYLNRPFKPTELTKVPEEDSIKFLLDLLREAKKRVVLCEGYPASTAVDKYSRSSVCAVWFANEETNYFRCKDCKNELRNIQRKRKRENGSTDVKAKRQKGIERRLNRDSSNMMLTTCSKPHLGIERRLNRDPVNKMLSTCSKPCQGLKKRIYLGKTFDEWNRERLLRGLTHEGFARHLLHILAMRKLDIGNEFLSGQAYKQRTVSDVAPTALSYTHGPVLFRNCASNNIQVTMNAHETDENCEGPLLPDLPARDGIQITQVKSEVLEDEDAGKTVLPVTETFVQNVLETSSESKDIITSDTKSPIILNVCSEIELTWLKKEVDTTGESSNLGTSTTIIEDLPVPNTDLTEPPSHKPVLQGFTVDLPPYVLMKDRRETNFHQQRDHLERGINSVPEVKEECSSQHDYEKICDQTNSDKDVHVTIGWEQVLNASSNFECSIFSDNEDDSDMASNNDDNSTDDDSIIILNNDDNSSINLNNVDELNISSDDGAHESNISSNNTNICTYISLESAGMSKAHPRKKRRGRPKIINLQRDYNNSKGGLCHKCGMVVKNVKRHEETHNEGKTMCCTICGAFLKNKKGLQRHMKCHTEGKRVQCEFCTKRFFVPSALQKHIKFQHMGERPFSCEICTKSFHTKGTLECHIRTHDDTFKFKCPICDKGFHQSGGLKTHVETHTKIKPFICKKCRKGYSTKNRLRIHEWQCYVKAKQQNAKFHPVAE